MGEEAKFFKARYLHGNCGRICGGHKWEGHAHYSGRSAILPQATSVERHWDGAAEVSRGRSRFVTAN